MLGRDRYDRGRERKLHGKVIYQDTSIVENEMC